MSDPDLWRRPHAIFRDAMAEGARIASMAGVTMFLRHADCMQILADERFGAMGLRNFEMLGWTEGAFVEWMRHNIVALDPPDHTRLRSLVNRAFTPRQVGRVRDLTHAAADDFADGMVARMSESGQVDFHAHFADLLPLTVICTMLGIPPVDHDRMRHWTDAVSRASGLPSPEDREDADRAIEALYAAAEDLVAQRRKKPGDDLLTALVTAEEEGTRLTHDHLLATIVQLLVAGHETTRNLLANGLYTLLRNPGQLRALRADPAALGSAVEEMLRYEPSIIWLARIARRDLDVGGVPVGAGEIVALNVSAANRDPDVFEEPDRFDVTRPQPRHLSFGYGAHYCLGAAVARMEAQVAFRVLLHRFGRISFAGAPPRFSAFTALRSLESLDIEVEPAPS